MESEVPVKKFHSALSNAGHYHIKEAENFPEVNNKKTHTEYCCKKNRKLNESIILKKKQLTTK
jgi:hypothetical protein